MKNDLWSKVLVTGADGIIGSYIDFGIKTDRNNLDVSNLQHMSSFFRRHRPKIIIHLAAQTDIDACEQNPDHAYCTNSSGTYNVALAAGKIGAKMVYISTDAVFNETKDTPHDEKDIPYPSSYYGHSKYLGELAVRGILKDYILIRTSWVFGGGPKKDKKFVGNIMRQLDKSISKEIKATNDSKSSPTYAKDLVAVIKKLLVEDKKGIFHIVNSGIATRYDMAKEILLVLEAKVKLCSVKSSFFRGRTAAPINTGGLVSRSIRLRPWQEALREYLETEWESLNRT